jgi:hypothetical protein
MSAGGVEMPESCPPKVQTGQQESDQLLDHDNLALAWCLMVFRTIGFEAGDKLAIVCPGACPSGIERVALLSGASSVLVLGDVAAAHEVPGLYHRALLPESLELKEELEKFFSGSPGRSFLFGFELSAGWLVQCLKSLPRWGVLGFFERAGDSQAKIPVDLYTDIHKRGIEVCGFTLPDQTELIRFASKAGDCLDQSRNLRRMKRIEVSAPGCLSSVEKG